MAVWPLAGCERKAPRRSARTYGDPQLMSLEVSFDADSVGERVVVALQSLHKSPVQESDG